MKKTLQAGLAGLAATVLLAASGNAAEWRFNNPLPETRPETKELVQFAEDVNKAVGEDFKVKMYNGGSLGLKNPDALRFLPKGAVEMSLVWANYLGRDAPALSAVFLQGSIGTVDELK